jgi:hypothetical protein
LDDGDTTKTAAQGASRVGTSGFYGRLLTVAQPVKQATIYASSNSGWSDTAALITFELKGSNTAPNADGSNGTTLKTLTASDTNAGFVTLISTDSTTAYLYHWIRISDATAGNMYMALATFTHPGAVLASASGGTGTLWMFAGGTVDVMDGLYYYGPRAVDDDGDLTLTEGDDFSGDDVVVGRKFSGTFEPFIPHAGEGQSAKQTLHKRQIGEGAVKVQQSTGFIVGERGATTPSRETAYAAGEDQGADPPQREKVRTFPINGSDFDPRIELTKDTPGTLRVLELSADVDI